MATWAEVYTNVKNSLNRKPHQWILSTIQNRMDMQNTYMDLRSMTHFLNFLSQKVSEEAAIAAGDTFGEGGSHCSVAGKGDYDG